VCWGLLSCLLYLARVQHGSLDKITSESLPPAPQFEIWYAQHSTQLMFAVAQRCAWIVSTGLPNTADTAGTRPQSMRWLSSPVRQCSSTHLLLLCLLLCCCDIYGFLTVKCGNALSGWEHRCCLGTSIFWVDIQGTGAICHKMGPNQRLKL